MYCDNCFRDIRISSLDLIDNLLKDIFKDICIEINLCRFILEYIINTSGHKIIYTRKSRRKPDNMDYDSEDEISGYYWTESNYVCTVCYQFGLQRSLDQQRRLPFLSCDINYFLTTTIDRNFLQSIYNIQLQCFLPKIYVIDYYRQKLPEKISSIHYLIKSK